MEILICDDDMLMRLQLKRLLEAYFEQQRLDVRITLAGSGEEASGFKKAFDLAFLDIEMNGLNGIQTGYRLRKVNPQLVIFIVTSYERYLDEAFDLNAFRFLHKPVEEQRLYKGLDSALSRARPVWIKTGGEQIETDSSSIVCVTIKARKTVVLTLTGEYESSQSLDYWRRTLSGPFFSQPHYSYLVNLNYVAGLEKDTVLLKYGNGLVYRAFCSQRKYRQFKQDFYAMLERRG